MPGRRGGGKKLSKAEMEYRLARLGMMSEWYGRAVVTAALALPIGVTMFFLQSFAGKNTDLNMNIAVSISFVANVVMAGTVVRKGKAMTAQGAELERLRGRAEVLEEKTGIVGKPSGGSK